MSLLIAALIIASTPRVAATATEIDTLEAKGLEIAKESDRRDVGFGDSQAQLVMTLSNRHGQTSARNLEVQTLEVAEDGDKSLVLFHSPRDVRGTAFLTYSHAATADDQWLYLPALKRVKRIASNNKSGPFMGSEFAYEDISSQEVAKYRYKFVKEEAVNGLPCFVIERYPVQEGSGYSKQVAWYDKAEYRPIKIDFYDRKDALLKTLEYRDYRQYLGQYWRSGSMFMQNHQTGKTTLLAWTEYQFKNGLSDAHFSKNRLKRAR